MAEPSHPASANARTVKQSAILAAVVIAAVVGFTFLGNALKIGPVYAGLLFFWYWAAIDQARFQAMPAALLGSICGTCTAWLLQAFAHQHNVVGLCCVLVFIIIAIFVQIAELVPIAINLPFMLFLTACGAPLLQASENFPEVLTAIGLAAVYFGLIVMVLTKLQSGAGAGNTPGQG